jgi:hypothetical protein
MILLFLGAAHPYPTHRHHRFFQGEEEDDPEQRAVYLFGDPTRHFIRAFLARPVASFPRARPATA